MSCPEIKSRTIVLAKTVIGFLPALAITQRQEGGKTLWRILYRDNSYDTLEEELLIPLVNTKEKRSTLGQALFSNDRAYHEKLFEVISAMADLIGLLQDTDDPKKIVEAIKSAI